ncbi:hypothetical protein HDU76_011841 [Blyttiomyces sp. JEL0837]|nr:hypothetical protein HDU76_011841 [Blyttiomyces sp. JEL0837]
MRAQSTPESRRPLWDRTPSEIIDNIMNSSDILTQYLNNRLTDIEIQQHATEIWNEAFRQEWPGDLTVLPSFGFPNAFTGLCYVHSKSMLNRLRLLRPDLDINNPGLLQDTLQVAFKNNTNFGWFPDDSAPVVALDLSDTIEPGGTQILVDSARESIQDNILRSLSASLIHISMRCCWVEDLEPYLTDNPLLMAKLAINNTHFDLLRYLVDTTKSLDLAMFPTGYYGFQPYLAITNNNNLDMFIYVHGEGCPVGMSLLAHAIIMGRLKILQYIHTSGMASRDQFLRTLAFGNDFRVLMDLDVWEWLLDTFCDQGFELCQWSPIASDINSARRIVSKLGFINYKILRMNAYHSSLEVFAYLWQHRSQPDPLAFLGITYAPEIHFLEVNVAIWRLIDLTHVQMFRFCSADVYRRAHANGKESIRRYYGNVELLQAIHEVCKCPGLRFSPGDMGFAVSVENMKALKFLHENRLEGCSQGAFLNCAGKGKLEFVKFLFDNRRGDCNLKTGLDLAVRAGHLDVVKYLVGKGEEVSLSSFNGCLKNGHIHTVKYLCEDALVPYEEAMNLAMKSGSLKLVRYLKQRFPFLKVKMQSLCDIFNKRYWDIKRHGAKLQMVDFIFSNCLDRFYVEKLYSSHWKERYWEHFDGKIVEYLMENEEKWRNH